MLAVFTNLDLWVKGLINHIDYKKDSFKFKFFNILKIIGIILGYTLAIISIFLFIINVIYPIIHNVNSYLLTMIIFLIIFFSLIVIRLLILLLFEQDYKKHHKRLSLILNLFLIFFTFIVADVKLKNGYVDLNQDEFSTSSKNNLKELELFLDVFWFTFISLLISFNTYSIKITLFIYNHLPEKVKHLNKKLSKYF